MVRGFVFFPNFYISQHCMVEWFN